MNPQLIMAALGQLGNLAGRVQDIANPVADPTKGEYKFNWGNALNPANGGILMELAKKMSMDSARSKYVMGASPGNYVDGGLIQQRMAESAMMNAMAANILGGRNNAMQRQPQQPVVQLAPPTSAQGVPAQQLQNIQQPIQQALAQQQTGPINVDEILSLPYKERRIAHHNPGNIKYGKFASKYGAVAGRKATDGGNIAIFPDWESGMKAKKDLLRSGGYKNLTLDEAMKRWSGYYVEPKPGHKRGGYGADRIAPQLANKKMADMTEDELNLVMKKMAKIEDGDVYKVIYGKAMGGELPNEYAKGGMISKAKAREILHDGTVHGNPITEKQRRFFGAMASRANGGEIMSMINPSNNIDMLNQPNAIRALLTGNTNQPMKMGGVMNYASGGDMKLSDNSFLVDGNPSVTDGNFYPQLNAKLDHGEVVKDNFVFSNKLRDPQTNVTYAKLAEPVEKSTGKAEKFMRRFQNDIFSKNTVMQNNKFLDSLSNKQEVLATAMGLRQEQQPMGYAVGGQVDPGNPRYMLVGNPGDYKGLEQLFYDPITNKFKGRTAFGDYMNYKYEALAPSSVRSQYKTGQDWINANAANINAFKANNGQSLTNDQLQQQYAALSLDPFLNATQNRIGSNNNSQGTTNTPWAFGPVTAQQRQDAALGDLRKAQADYEARTGYKQNPNEAAYQNLLSSMQQQEAMDAWNQAGELGPTGPQPDLGFTTPDQRAQMLDQMYAKNDPAFVAAMQERAGTSGVPAETTIKGTTPSTRTGMGQKWTVGDYMNAAAVLGRFGQLIGGPEVEKPVYDTTAITRQVYDPASALYQTNRQTAGMLNRMDVPSINARTSIANNMLAQRLNQDAQTLSSYQNMNAQALRDYETRATEQRRYNIGQTLATNQMNAQNRAAYKQAVDNAMTSLGGFGTAMNEKTQAYDMLNILKTIYPEVYRRIMAGQKITLADSEAIKEATKTVQDATGTTTTAPAPGSTNAPGGATTTAPVNAGPTTSPSLGANNSPSNPESPSTVSTPSPVT